MRQPPPPESELGTGADELVEALRKFCHDVSTPLAVAAGNANWLNNRVTDAEQLARIGRLRDALDQMVAMLAKLKETHATLAPVQKGPRPDDEFTAFFSASLDLFCIVNGAGFFRSVNPRFASVLGYSEAEMLSTPCMSLIHPDDIAGSNAAIKRAARGEQVLNFENRFRCKDGSYRLISWHCQVDRRSDTFYATGRDLTDQNRTEKDLNGLMRLLDGAAIVAHTDAKGRITEVNDNFCKISGYSREELLGKTHQLVNSGEHNAAFFADLWKTIASGKTWTGDIKNKRKDGTFYWVRTVISQKRNDAGQFAGYLAIRFEITNQKNLEDLTKKMSDELKEAQSIAKIGSWTFDLATHQLTWSAEHYKIFEIEESQPKELLYEMYRTRIHHADLEKLDRLVRRAVETGEGFVYDHRVICKDGTIKHVQGIGKVTRDSHGRPTRLTGTCQDITDRVQREEENRFILDALGIGVWKFNPVTKDLHWDKSLYQLYEISEKDFSSHYSAWENSLTPEAKAKAVEELAMALRGEKEFDTTFEINTATHGRKYIAGLAKVIRNDRGEPVVMYGVNFDRTKEELASRALENEKLRSVQSAKLASLGEMAAGVAHEINNPLAIVTAGVRVLPKFVGDPQKLGERIATIQKASERIAKIVRSLKKYSRSADTSVHAVHLARKIIEEAVTLTATKAKRHGTAVNFELNCDGPILCDDIEIEQVLVNLVNNSIDAVKDLPERWVKIALAESDSEVIIHVSDSGRGIPDEIQAKLFQPFFTTKVVGEGTGLGLSIVKGILDEHKGSISVLKGAKNTCFEIRFAKAEELKHAS